MEITKIALGSAESLSLLLEGGQAKLVFDIDIKKLIDQLEVMIPGDQTGMAFMIKKALEGILP